MSAPHICLTCRRSIRQLQWKKSILRHSSFISLANAQNNSGSRRDHDHLLELADNPKTFDAPKTRQTHLNTRHEPADALELLFEETMRKVPNETVVSSQKSNLSIDAYKHHVTLGSMLAEGQPLDHCWKFFLQHFGPMAWKAKTIDETTAPMSLKSTEKYLVKKIMASKTNEPFSTNMPRYSEMILNLFELGMLQGHQWTDMMIDLLGNIIRTGSTSMEAQPLVSDLLLSWNIVCRRLTRNAAVEIHPSISNWSQVPVHSTKSIRFQFQSSRGQYGIRGALALFAPSFLMKELNRLTPVVMGTIKVLLDFEKNASRDLSTTTDLLEILVAVIYACDIQLSHFVTELKILRNQFPGSSILVEAIINDWAAIKARANQSAHLGIKSDWTSLNASAKEYKPSVRVTHCEISSAPSKLQSGYLHNRLRDASLLRDSKQVETLWEDAQQLPVQKTNTSAAPQIQIQTNKKLKFLDNALCNQFIRTFMGLRQPHRAIAVWNYMLDHGIVPEVNSWDAMLNGCKVARDPVSLQEVWAKMIASGTSPDIVCWTSRITALIHCYKPDAAMVALDELGRQWLLAVRKKFPNIPVEKLQEKEIPGVAKPTIETINAAVSGLITHHRREAAQKILTWAGKLGIGPNIHTYNILLRPMIRDGESEKASVLLRVMESEGIKADAATFVMVLEDVLRDAQTQTSEEQSQAVSGVFKFMKEAGVQVNEQVYNKIIYLLLQASPDDTTAISAVIQHMAQEGIQPKAHTYTMLLGHYFNLQPPDLEAVRILIERSDRQVASVDHIFWDRVIEGYAKVGDTATALRYLGKVHASKHHLSISWNTLRTVLMALIDNDEWTSAEELVKNTIKDTGGPISRHAKGIDGQHRFWELAGELRLLGNDN